MGASWGRFNHLVGQVIGIAAVLCHRGIVHQVFNRPLEDVAPVVDRAADHVEAFVDCVTEEPFLRVDHRVVRGDPNRRRGPDRNRDRVLLDRTDSEVGQGAVKGPVDKRRGGRNP